MGVNNSWRQPRTMDEWMRDIEKRLMHEERRPQHAKAADVVGSGIGAYSRLVEDWNAEGPIIDGFFYSIADSIINSPDDSKNWMGLVQANSIGQGLQRVWEYISDPVTPSPDPGLFTRSFVTNADGSRNYTPWLQGGGGGGGGTGSITVQDEGTTIAETAQLDFYGAGVVALAGTGEVQLTIDGTPKGPASGGLTGNYPGPTLAANSVGAAQIIDGSVGSAEIANGSLLAEDFAPGVIPVVPPPPTTLPPSGPAGGDLTGNYPNPQINADTVVLGDLAPALKDGTAASKQVRALGGGATDAAAGDHSHFITAPIPHAASHQPGGSDPMAVDAVPTTGSLRTLGTGPQQAAVGSHSHGNPGMQVEDEGASIILGATKMDFKGAGVTATPDGVNMRAIVTIPGGGPPSGPAGGGLSGTYPNPNIATDSIGPGQIISGAVGPDEILDGGVGTTELANQSVTLGKMAPNSVDSSKVVDGSLTAADLAPGTIPTTLPGPPTGPAGGDLGGTYPDPTVLKARSGFTVGTPGGAGAMSATDALFVGVNGLTECVRTRLAGDTHNRFHVNANGLIVFGSGAATPDVNLYRNAADTLRTDDTLSVGGQLDLNANKLVNLAPGTVGTDGVNKTQLDAKTATGAAGGDLTGTYPNPEIGAGKVGNAELAPDAVTTDKIADGTIQASDLAPGVIPVAPTKHANPGFDGTWIANAHGAVPPSWNDFYMAAGVVANMHDTTDFIGGGGSAKITQPATGAAVNTRLYNQDAFGVSPGDTLTVSVWAKTDLPSPTLNIFLNSGPTAAAAVPLGSGNQQSRPFPITTTWTQYSASFTVPPGDVFARISFTGSAIGAGSWWLDESSSSSVSPPPATGLVPVGALEMFAGVGAIPTGWLVCEGQAVNRTTYAALFSIIGTTYGVGDGTTTFNLPNMKGNVAVGANSGADVGFTGGEAAHTLTVAEMPSHNHPAAVKQAYVAGGNVAKQGASTAVDWTIPARVDTIENAGGGAAHNIMQPYVKFRFIIKT